MLETLRNAWKIKELRKKLLYTVGMLLVYRLLCFVPTPGVNLAAVRAAMQNFSLLEYINSMTGSNLGNFTIMAMGITPYINASIIMQLLCVAIPKLEEMQKEGEEGRKKIAQITRYVTVGLGFIQAVALSAGLGATSGFGSHVLIGLCLAAGTALAMWIGERITKEGIGNGISLLIMAGIIANIAVYVAGMVSNLFNFEAIAAGHVNPWIYIPVVLISLVLIVAVVFVNRGERRVPVQYAKRVVGRKMYGGQSSYIPMRVDSSGVLPLIFASSIMQFPSTILSLWSGSALYQWWSAHVNAYSIGYQIIFALMIVGFTYFYTSMTFNPADVAQNIKENGGSIPGIRQGKPTEEYLRKISTRITLFDGIYLAILACLPTLLAGLAGLALPFAASSLLIAVSVATETTTQIESELMMRHYKGFLK